MRRLYLVRHSPAAWPEAEPGYRGWSDAGLSETGAREAERVAGWFAGRFAGRAADVEGRISPVYTSDLARAVETARAIASVAGSSGLRVREGLREISFGEWEGRSHGELMLDGPETYRRWLEDPFSVSPPGGEGFGDFARRVKDTFSQILAEGPGDARAVLVGHGGSLRVILCDLLGMPDENHWRVRLDHSSISLIEFSGDTPVLRALNDTSHLGDDGDSP